MLRLLSACCALGASPGVLGFDDSSVLVQRASHETPNNPDKPLFDEEAVYAAEIQHAKDAEWSDWNLCTSRAMKKYEDTKQSWAKAEEEYRLQELQKQADHLNATLVKLLSPLGNATREGLELLRQAVRPTALRLVKYGIQQVLKPNKPYVNHSVVNLPDTLSEFQALMKNSTIPQEEAIFKRGLESFDAGIDEHLQGYSPQLRALFPNLAKLPESVPPLRYISERALPTLFLKDAPVVSGLLLLLRLPPSSEKVPAFFNGTIQPFLNDQMPKECQSQQLLTDIALGGGSLMGRVGKFMAKCSAKLGMAPNKAPPKRKCITCRELYQKLTSDAGNSNSCASHCSPLLLSCMGGMTDGCLGAFVPCLRCHRNRLDQLDKCEGHREHAEGVAQLGTLLRVFQTGTVKQASVDKFVERLSDALVP